MNVVEVVPLLSLPRSQPQILSYFSSQEVIFGSLVEVALGKKSALAVVISVKSLVNKLDVKKMGFSLKPIKKIINNKATLTKEQWFLIKWLSEYYYLPITGILRLFLLNKSLLKKLDVHSPILRKAEYDQKNIILSNSNIAFLKEEINRIIKNNQQVFILTPNNIRLDIYLEHLKDFQDDLVVFDRQVSINNLKKLYQDINSNQKKIIISRRNGIFAPFNDLGMIVVDEPENYSHETWETKIHFNSQNACFALAKIFNASLFFVSDDPSVEVREMIQRKEFKKIDEFLQINNKIKIVNSLGIKNSSIFVGKTLEEIKNVLDQKGQVVVFANRRGFSSALVCKDCGYVSKCPNCDSALVYHYIPPDHEMRCHHCDFKKQPGNVCPKCGGFLIKFLGNGTQKVVKELESIFPQFKIAQFDSDCLKTSKDEQEVFDDFLNKRIEILVVTELFVKFLDKLSKIDLTIFNSADQFFIFPDFRNEEKFRQLIKKFNKRSSNLIIQTFEPDKEFFKNLNQEDQFYDEQLRLRRNFSYPPFVDLVKIQFTHKYLNQLERLSDYLFKVIKKNSDKLFGADGYSLMPVSFASIPKMKNLYVKEIIWKINKFDFDNTSLALARKRNKILDLMPDNAIIKINQINLT